MDWSLCCRISCAVVLLAASTISYGAAGSSESGSALSPVTRRRVKLPDLLDLRRIQAKGPLNELARMSYARQLEGPFGSDWSDPNEPGDGRGRWIQALCNLGAYLHVKPEPMMDEVQRMKQMRNPNGFFGLPNLPEVVQAQASFDNSWPILWGMDFTANFDDSSGVQFAREIADAFYVPRTAYFEPYGNVPGSHWVGEYGHGGVGFGGIVGMARLAMVTGDERYEKSARALADTFLTIDYEHNHGHCTSTALIGLLHTHELTGDRKYLDAAIRGADSTLLRNEQASMAFMGGLGSFNYSEGCGISDWFYLNMMLGRTTGKASYYDRAERILWGPFMHHLRPNGGLGNDIVASSDGLLQIVAGYEAPGCCTMWAPNGLVRAFTFAVQADGDGLTIPLYYPFTATASSRNGDKIELSMRTSYPDDGSVTVSIDRCSASEPWRLRFRAPAWSAVTSLKVNGKPERAVSRSGWVSVKRAWKSGDEVSFVIPMRVWLSRPNSDDVLKLPRTKTPTMLRGVRAFRGPMLLGVDKQRNPDLDWVNGPRFVLYLSGENGELSDLPQGAATNGIDQCLSYPRAHLGAAVGPTVNGVPRLEGGVFVSDMEWVSATAGAGNSVRRDTNIGGKTITMSGMAFGKGVWTHAFGDDTPADVVIDVSSRTFSSFAASVGLEDSAGPGSVKFQVLVDGVVKAESPIIRQRTLIHPINVDVTGAKQVVLRVTNGGDGNSCDHAAWGFARFIEKGANDPLLSLSLPSDAAPFDASSVDPDLIRRVVLTPIAECPGRTGASPKAVEDTVTSNREAILFDVVVGGTNSYLELLNAQTSRR